MSIYLKMDNCNRNENKECLLQLNIIFIQLNKISSTVWFRALKSGIFSKRIFNSSKDFFLRRLKWKISHTKWTYSTPFRSRGWFGWFALTILSSILYFGMSSSILSIQFKNLWSIKNFFQILVLIYNNLDYTSLL